MKPAPAIRTELLASAQPGIIEEDSCPLGQELCTSKSLFPCRSPHSPSRTATADFILQAKHYETFTLDEYDYLW